MNHDDHDDLWELLGKAREPAVSPYFSRHVLRTIRNGQSGTVGGAWVTWVLRHWQTPAMAACALAIAGLVLEHRPAVRGERPQPAVAAQPLAPETTGTLAALPDLGVIGHLDELMDSESNSVWLAGDAE